MSARTFSHAAAVRRPDPVLLGVSGPSSSGKTKTALRLATGLVSVTGGRIFFIDTEEGRAAKYAPAPGAAADPPDTFAFEHVFLTAPFNPLSYVAAIEHCEAYGAGAIIIDSMSHEHEGEGGRLDSADKEAQRRAERWKCSIDKVKFGAFAPNSAERNQFRFKLGRRKAHIILCFRAKETNTQEGKEIVDQGFTPIGADAFVWELDSSILLLPHAAGVPTWTSRKKGELLCLKCDDTHRDIFKDGKQLTEAHGARLAHASGWKAQSAPRADAAISAQNAGLPSRPAEGASGFANPTSGAPSPPPSSFPGDFVEHAGARHDPARAEPLRPSGDSDNDLRAFARALARLLEQAPDDVVRRAWFAANTDNLLRLAARLPTWHARLRAKEPSSARGAEQDAADPAQNPAAGGAAAASSGLSSSEAI